MFSCRWWERGVRWAQVRCPPPPSHTHTVYALINVHSRRLAYKKKSLLDLLLNFLRSSRRSGCFEGKLWLSEIVSARIQEDNVLLAKKDFHSIILKFVLFSEDKRKCKRPTIVSHLLINSILNFFSRDEREMKSFSLNIKDDKTLWSKLRMVLSITDSFLDHLVSYVPLCLKEIVYPKMKSISLFM